MAKRATDLVVGTLLALVVTPVILFLAAGVALELRTSPFFVQRRLGRDGASFHLIKLRTLPPDAPAYADKYEVGQIVLPPLVRWLRRLHLDELPQLWLVPLGRMSLVGPRPEMAFLHDRMPEAVARRRLSVRPGCTGLWQVSRHAHGLIHEHPEYDLAYVNHATLALDLWIVWRTVTMLLGRARDVTLASIPAWALRGEAGVVIEIPELTSDVASSSAEVIVA